MAQWLELWELVRRYRVPFPVGPTWENIFSKSVLVQLFRAVVRCEFHCSGTHSTTNFLV